MSAWWIVLMTFAFGALCAAFGYASGRRDALLQQIDRLLKDRNR